jgi:hypothetical protein
MLADNPEDGESQNWIDSFMRIVTHYVSQVIPFASPPK